MRRLAGLLVAPVLLLGAGCRGDDPPAQPDQQVSDVESTLDSIEAELAGD